MTSIEQLIRDKQLSSSTRLVAAEILRKIDPVTGRARITAEQLADTLHIAVGTVRKATNVLTDRSYFRKVKVGRNIEFVVEMRLEAEKRDVNS
jgi:Cu/Ag efflux protein CusF